MESYQFSIDRGRKIYVTAYLRTEPHMQNKIGMVLHQRLSVLCGRPARRSLSQTCVRRSCLWIFFHEFHEIIHLNSATFPVQRIKDSNCDATAEELRDKPNKVTSSCFEIGEKMASSWQIQCCSIRSRVWIGC